MTKEIRDILLYIFKEGLDEDAWYRASTHASITQISESVALQNLISERASLQNSSLEAELLDFLIEDLIQKDGGQLKLF